MEKLLVPIRKDVETIKSDVGKLQTQHSSLDQRVAALEKGTTVGSEFKPTYLELRGFCEFANSKTEGISRADASILLNKLKAGLDPTLQQHVRDLQLRGARNYKVRIPVTPEYLSEIRNTWNDMLEAEPYKGKQLKVTAELHPDFQKRCAVFGKVCDWATASLDTSLSPKSFWAPDFTLMVTTSQEDGPMGVKPASILCHVTEKAETQWEGPGLQAAGLSEEDARRAVMAHRRQRQ